MTPTSTHIFGRHGLIRNGEGTGSSADGGVKFDHSAIYKEQLSEGV